MIYFIQEDRTGPIKIGYTSRTAKSRLDSLQTGNARQLYLIKEIEGTEEEVQEIYTQFKHIRMKGEWFQPTMDLMVFINDLLKVEINYQNLLNPTFIYHINHL